MCLSSLTIQTLCVTLSLAAQHFPSWGHYDLCKTRLYWDQGMSWDYMACQPEANLLTKFLKIKLDPPNNTCGDSPEMYCTLENPYMCNNECDARTPELAHPPELMLDDEGRIPNTFWQSVSWRNFPQPLLVNITLSWGKSIELTEDIVITFESGRPEQMVLEKSLDHGRTWQPYQFYAADCLNSFGMEARRAQDLSQASVLDIICTEQYSRGYVWKVDKMVRFEIQERLSQFGGPRLSDMASLYGQLDTIKELRDFFTLTDLRLRLLRPATGPTSVDPLNLSKYFYAISNLDIRGRACGQKHNRQLSCRLCFEKCVCVQGEAGERCKCNLHANNCIVKKDRLSCVCEHNTTGPDCGRCRKGYQGRRWRAGSYLPIPKGTANVCLPDTVTSGSGVCDNLLTRCQNGGVCEDNGTCRCPALYTGLLCEKVQCGKEAGGCTSRSPRVPTLPRLLLSLTALLIAADGCPLL